MKTTLMLSVMASTLLVGAPAAAQDWPSQPIRLTVPYAAGGPTDVMGRFLAEQLTQRLGQPVIILNRGGAGGTIGVAEVLRADPDGYTLALVAPGPVAGMHALTEVNYALDDIEYISLVARNPAVIGVNTQSGIQTLQELIDKAKQNPNTLNFSSAGNGTTPHIGAELFRQQADIDTLHIPYKGTAPAVTALLAGDVDYISTDLPALLPHHQGGRLKILAVSGNERAPQIPDVPTTVELGLPGVVMETHYGIVGPRGIPADRLQKLQDAIAEISQTPGMKQFMIDSGGVAMASTGDEYRTLMYNENEKWREVARIGNITLN